MTLTGRIRKSFGPLSSGTRCEIVGTNASDGTNTVSVGPFSAKFYEQNHPIVDEIKRRGGLVDVPFELVEFTTNHD